MSKRSEALAIVPDSYRPMPEGRDKTGPVEVSACMWCEFINGSRCDSPTMATEGDVLISGRVNFVNDLRIKMTGIPQEVYEPKLEAREQAWVSMVDGECPGYRPSLWTRILRKVGLRRPVMR